MKKVAKKVVKKGSYEQRSAGQALQSFSSKVFSTDNWVFQARTRARAPPHTAPRLCRRDSVGTASRG